MTDTSYAHYLDSSPFVKATKVQKRVGLAQFSEWLAQSGRKLDEATERDVITYLAELQDSGKPTNSVTSRFYVLRGYYTWLEKQGAITRSPMAHLRASHKVLNYPSVVSVDDLRRLLSVAQSDTAWVLVAVLAFNSLRVSELLDCNVTSIERRKGVAYLRFEPTLGQNRLPHTIIAPEVDEVLVRLLAGRGAGPLFLNRSGQRMHRGSASALIWRAGQKAGIPYRVTPQMLSYTLHEAAMTNGFTFVSMLKAAGVPQPRQSGRWLTAEQPLSQDNASLRLARMVLQPVDSTQNSLSQVEAVLSDHSSPEAFALAAAGAILERHLRNLAVANGTPAPTGTDLGSMSKWAGELQSKGIVRASDRQLIDSIANLRNLAAHGFFERIDDGLAERTYQSVKSLVSRYPLPREHPAQ